ncbi:MAG: asparagine synthase (glutamine-hydrolyzing) [Gemmatimonadaceae bacterium]|nr:asparagine synthase (glutamine-hydrolyzing) [Gemmatimonadaceae bacterium]NUQ91444.1 asparagine synthase (glutamine-hydrolyzing) [Gemmatimonadaceae bacterium]NUR20282.1 asparagine synthase (glutamine-hydrolyzing) [Gemmatimonadaceae bacterium]NUS95971.1 asparagine synthase (glutamine-hydrolyzing) [Gemmatimonadaceae bacterium]
MCGIAGIFGRGWRIEQLDAMAASQHHRGPDARGRWLDPSGRAGLAHNRLAIIDLSEAGRQPMFSADGLRCIVFNGEIYNYLELRAELAAYLFRTRTDSEVILAAWERWGEACLDHFVGMFAFMLWDSREQRLFAARDRFGVKPLYLARPTPSTLAVASEIGALREAGIAASPDATTWASYLAAGLTDHSARTFWEGITALPAGHKLSWRGGEPRISRWYDLAASVGDATDDRSDGDVQEEYLGLLVENVRLRFRSDVPVGINLSGGLDSSLLLGLVHQVQGPESEVAAFTFVTGDPAYDELPWVRAMVEHTRHPLVTCTLAADDVPALAASVSALQLEPFGGIPTLAYARLFEEARARGVIVLLDGQGMDEQWAGYDYYRRAAAGGGPLVQGTTSAATRPGCLVPEFRALAEPAVFARPGADELRNLQLRDATRTKIPRALRYNDRVSMRASIELREPFLDHRLFELALRQPVSRKIRGDVGKWLPRSVAPRVVPRATAEAPKRPLQTPQREWLRGPLRGWCEGRLEQALEAFGDVWLDRAAVRDEWRRYVAGESDNSFYVWQWVSLGILAGEPSVTVPTMSFA